MLRPMDSRPAYLGVGHPSGAHYQIFITVWQFRVSWCGVPSLRRGWVCNLLVQLLLGLARAVTLGSRSHRNHDPILLSLLRLPQPGGPGPRIYIPQEQGDPVIPSGTGFPFRRLLRLTRLQLRNYTRLHTGCLMLKLKLIYDRQSVGQPVLVSGAHLGPVTNFSFSLKFLLDSWGFVIL
jgi:hypothetical protein